MKSEVIMSKLALWMPFQMRYKIESKPDAENLEVDLRVILI